MDLAEMKFTIKNETFDLTGGYLINCKKGKLYSVEDLISDEDGIQVRFRDDQGGTVLLEEEDVSYV
jgi:hypothetical protein